MKIAVTKQDGSWASLPGSLTGGGTCLDLFARMSGMALSAELSAVLFVDVLFDWSELKAEESLVV